MKKIVFSLFIFASVFYNAAIVSAESIHKGASMGYCMSECQNAPISQEECRNSCAARVYSEVGDCIKSCNDSSCLKTCTKNYLDMHDFSSTSNSGKISTCTSVCGDITGIGSENCNSWCKDFYDNNVARGKEYGECMQSCTYNGAPVNCESYCAATTYSEVKSCINSCDFDSEDKSPLNSCVSEYLNNFHFNSLNTSDCVNTCRNMTGQGVEACNKVCDNYLSGKDANYIPDLKIWDKVQCGDLKMPYLFAVIVNTIISFIKILVPIILVILGSLDLSKAVMAQKEDEIKKGQQVFIRRLVIGVILFITFALVQLVIGVVAPHNDNESMWDCIDCLVNKDCE